MDAFSRSRSVPSMRYLCGLILLALSVFAADPSPASGNAAAITLYRERKNEEARAAFEQLATANPQNAEALRYLGLIAFREKRIDDAIAYHEKAVALKPDDPDYLLDLGESYSRKVYSASVFAKLGWAKKCRAVIEKAVALDPAHPIANAALAEYYFKAPGIAGGSIAKAYEQAEILKKYSPLGGADLQASLYLRERKYPELFAALDETLRTHPDHYPALFAFGHASADLGQHLDRGAQSLERCLQLTPPPRAPGHASAWFHLGQIRARQNDIPAARTAYETALKLNPAHREATAALEKLPRQSDVGGVPSPR